jgi:hypothetical protein
MNLVAKSTLVPARTQPDERNHEGILTNAVKAEFGRAAVDVGSVDRGLNDNRTDAVDAIANIMLWLDQLRIDPEPVLDSAARHFYAETDEGS